MQPRLLLRICFSRRTLKIGCLLLLIAGATIFIADRVMVNASKQLTWSDVNAVPARNVGLLLGARPGNRYFTRRNDTAAALYHAGKVKWLLVSGDNGRKNYDEAEINVIKSILDDGIERGFFSVPNTANASLAIVTAMKGLEYPFFVSQDSPDQVNTQIEALFNILFYGISVR